MNIALPTPLDAFVKAENAHDVEAFVACFTPEALVHDENKDRRGATEIRTWISEAFTAYHQSVEVKSVESEGSEIVLTSIVWGTFEGSPIEITHRFTLEGDRIVKLVID